jgi:hypothetical protein
LQTQCHVLVTRHISTTLFGVVSGYNFICVLSQFHIPEALVAQLV